MNITLAALVSCLGDAKMTVGMAAGQTLGCYAERTQNFRHLVDVVVKHGLEAHDLVTRKGVLMNLSFLCVPEQRVSDFRPFVTSLVSQLSDSRVADSKPSIINCLDKISKLVGQRRFDSYLSGIQTAQRDHYFQLLTGTDTTRNRLGIDSSSATSTGSSNRDQDLSANDGFVFGVVPVQIIERLSDASDSRSQVIASEDLRLVVENAKNHQALRPNVLKFFEYVASLLEYIDNFQVCLFVLLPLTLFVQRRVEFYWFWSRILLNFNSKILPFCWCDVQLTDNENNF